jgi:hypothetical protein
MGTLFHQNMRVFGGGSANRNTAYKGPPVPPGGGFGTISAAIGGGPVGPVLVAGFTEVMNNGASNAALTTSCLRLGVAWQGNIACGITALARNGPEYIGIGVNAGNPIHTYGRMLISAGGGGVQLIHQRSGDLTTGVAGSTAGVNARGMGNASADFRGLVYVVINIGGANNIAVGFLHNLYTFQAQRTLVMGQLGNMLNRMGAAANGLPAVPNIIRRYIGGDFNVAFQANRPGAFGFNGAPAMGGYPPASVGGGTTWSGNTYDYWYSDQNGAVAPTIAPAPAAHTATLDSGTGAPLPHNMSDHTGIWLQVT